MLVKKERYKTGRFALTRAEYEAIRAVIDNFEDEVLIRLAVASGMRREDIVNVKISDIKLEDHRIFFFEHKKDKIHSFHVSGDLMQLVVKYLGTLPRNQQKLLDMSSKTAYNRFQRLCERAGIPKRPFHALRSTCIKFCQLAGWTPEQTAALVDDTIAVIQEHYLTPSEAEMKEVCQKKGFA